LALECQGGVQVPITRLHNDTYSEVGFLRVADVLTTGLNQCARRYYPQTHKQAMIIDMRGSADGNGSPMLIERLRREISMITIARNSVPDVNPTGMIYGPKVCLLNEFSASDGDLFPYRFRYHHLGKLIGKRSWGGVVGIRGALPLLDGGYLNRPEFSRYDVAGKEWIIEGVGVPPDIEVDNDPGRDEYGLPPVDVEITDDARELDRDVQAYQRELRARRRNMRVQRLSAPRTRRHPPPRHRPRSRTAADAAT